MVNRQQSQRDSGVKVRFIEIEDDDAGQRLDNFLRRQLKGVPKSHIYRILRMGGVRINKGRSKPDYRLQAGDIVRIPPVRTATRQAPRKADDLDWLNARILHEDDDLLAIDKPSGMAVHGGSGISLGLIEALRQLRPKCRFLELVHRLDRDTSGVLLIAKRRPVLRQLHEQLRNKQIQKHYVALLMGRWSGKAQRVEAPLEKNQQRSGERMVQISETGKSATSRFTPRKNFTLNKVDAALVEIKLITGRTHQARVHAVHLGKPIAGDEKYGDKDFNAAMKQLGLKRMFLHAARLEFTHPAQNCKIRIEAPLPEDLGKVLEKLGSGT
jgi:23S rRNA pseudouridine955/2504/2580 synthase